jgi:hypothetical protein
MQQLHNAYMYVMQQVETNSSVTFEQLEQDFKSFCDSQTQAPPPFRHIFDDTFNPEFNKRFNEQLSGVAGVSGVAPAFASGGYDVEPSQFNMDGLADCPPTYSPSVDISTDLRPLGTTKAVVNSEFMAVQCLDPKDTVCTDIDLHVGHKKMDDYTCNVGNIQGTDYFAAYSTPPLLPRYYSDSMQLESEPTEDEEDVHILYDRLMQQRSGLM